MPAAKNKSTHTNQNCPNLLHIYWAQPSQIREQQAYVSNAENLYPVPVTIIEGNPKMYYDNPYYILRVVLHITPPSIITTNEII